METARLVAFAFGVYVSGAVFALAARRLWVRWNLDLWGVLTLGADRLLSLVGRQRKSPVAAPPPAAAQASAAPMAAAPMLADLTDALDDPEPSVADLDDPLIDVPAMDVSAGDSELDDLLAAWLPEDPDDTTADPIAEVDIGRPPAVEAAPEPDSAGLARAHRNALELALSEIRPLEEKLGFLARHVRRLEAELGSRAASADETNQLHFARELLVQQAELAALERRDLVDELARARAQRDLEVRADRERWASAARRLAELDRRFDEMAAALRAAESASAVRDRQLDEAQSLVRAERAVADRIRGLLASFQLPG
ncbi:MAG: hypothetical protein GC161_05555 [Planctomycetaceae bacterium]|nr:hypothetical protein [Planctomycetaceae bacterium]